MGRPLNSTVRVEDVNATLRHLLGQEAEVPRDAWDRMLLKRYGIGIEMADNLTRTGEKLGYWIREKGAQTRDQAGRLAQQVGRIRFRPQHAPEEQPDPSPQPSWQAALPTTSPSATAPA